MQQVFHCVHFECPAQTDEEVKTNNCDPSGTTKESDAIPGPSSAIKQGIHPTASSLPQLPSPPCVALVGVQQIAVPINPEHNFEESSDQVEEVRPHEDPLNENDLLNE